MWSDYVFVNVVSSCCITTTFPSVHPGTPATPATPANLVQGLPDWASQISNTDTVAAVAQILQSPQGQQVRVHVLSMSVFKLLNEKSW